MAPELLNELVKAQKILAAAELYNASDYLGRCISLNEAECALLTKGEVIGAIKALRERTNLSVSDAKAVVDAHRNVK